MKARKDKKIQIRLSESEFEQLQEIRTKYKVSISELVRESLLFYNYQYPLK
jgi:hypothetical protein